METCFVLITCEAGTTDKVIKKLQMIDEIKEAIPVLGAFDIITKVTAPTTEALKNIVIQNIELLKTLEHKISKLFCTGKI